MLINNIYTYIFVSLTEWHDDSAIFREQYDIKSNGKMKVSWQKPQSMHYLSGVETRLFKCPDVTGKINRMQDLMTTIYDVKHQRHYTRIVLMHTVEW